MSPLDVWKTSLNDAQTVLQQFTNSPQTWDLLAKFSKTLVDCYKKNGKVLICGNGGSHCDALHFAEELTGRYRKDRKPLGALALGEASHVTCVSNDYGFQYIFSRQVEGLGRSGDVLIGLSTSGNSANVIEAFKTATSMGIPTIALLGKGGGELLKMADLAIVVPGVTSDRIQELHMFLLHTVIETIERDIFPENYK
ncbi:MAG: D-sedoheptulose 7-phosphate isomerase [Bdellovibrionaceae bacterium]|nr:D-sedoheptulose 7-phosphate isomerase [Pseudobdellovibrionaceae bacterium]